MLACERFFALPEIGGERLSEYAHIGDLCIQLGKLRTQQVSDSPALREPSSASGQEFFDLIE